MRTEYNVEGARLHNWNYLKELGVDSGKEIRHFLIADDYFNINTLEDLKEGINIK